MDANPWGVPRALRVVKPVEVKAPPKAKAVQEKKPQKVRTPKATSTPRRHDPLTAHDRHLRRTYGITLAEYDAMFQAQGGLCALCLRTERTLVGINGSTDVRRLHVDHDHVSGKIRALLCSACNSGLGHFEHDPWLLEQAAKYVTNHSVELAWKLA
jgi:hypothetical protein